MRRRLIVAHRRLAGKRKYAAELIIDGLPIMLREPSFTPWSIPPPDLYYTDRVIGGPGTFVVPVEDPSQFVTAIRQKLVLVIASAPPRLLPAAAGGAEPRNDCLIGEGPRRQFGP